MDINDIRTLITTLSFIVFAGIVVWAWSSRQRQRFDEAAQLPFADDDLLVSNGKTARKHARGETP